MLKELIRIYIVLLKMKQSKYLLPIKRKTVSPIESLGHDLCVGAGLIHQLGSGIYTFLPTGQRVIHKIENIIRQEMNKTGAQEISMPLAQPISIWEESGRAEIYGEELNRLTSRDGSQLVLGPTHEEVVTHLMRTFVQSYKQLPKNLYQIGRKFRDELRPRHGLLRTREFVMKDAYSFDIDEKGMKKSYATMKDAYLKIFDRLGIEVIIVSADSGEVGGSSSEEFMAPALSGEDNLYYNVLGVPITTSEKKGSNGEKVRRVSELGHIFMLSDRYSKPMRLEYTTSEGNKRPVMMGCYGIGVSRILHSLIEQHHDKNGIVWPTSVAPFDLHLIQVGNDPDVERLSEEVYGTMKMNGVDLLHDDRNVSAGIKFNDSNVLGIPLRLIIGKRSLDSGKFEFEVRKTNAKHKTPNYLQTYNKLIDNL